MSPGMAEFRIPCCKVHKNYSQPYLFCCIPLPLQRKIRREIKRPMNILRVKKPRKYCENIKCIRVSKVLCLGDFHWLYLIE